MDLYKLNNHHYAQCALYRKYPLIHGVMHIEWGFLSYNTRVIIVRGSRVIFSGYYSRTTSRQMTWWLAEHGDKIKGLTSQTLKIMAEKGLAYDFETGELTPLTHDELREIRHERDRAFNYGYGW